MSCQLIAFYTDSGTYDKEARRFELSLHRAGVPQDQFYIEKYLDHGNWNRNTAIKPQFIRDYQKAEPTKSLLYIDVDAVIHQNPLAYFAGLEPSYDFACYFSPEGRLLSGTLWFNHTEAAAELLETWIQRNLDKAAAGDWTGGGQRNLWETLTSQPWPQLRMHRLPGRYCWAFRRPEWYGQEPRIIEHLLASRENRDESAGKVDPVRRTRIQEIEESWTHN